MTYESNSTIISAGFFSYPGQLLEKSVMWGRYWQIVTPPSLPLNQINPAVCFYKYSLNWNTATLVHLCVVCGCFCATMAEFHCCDRDGIAK